MVEQAPMEEGHLIQLTLNKHFSYDLNLRDFSQIT